MLKGTSDFLQHRARHPGPRTDRIVGFGSKQRKRERHDAFKRIIAAELRWTSLKLPSWVIAEIRSIGLRQWLDVQHKRSEEAAGAVLKGAARQRLEKM